MENNDIFFVKFPKIYENMGEFKAPKKLEWIATEKIDGSNFSIYSNGKDTKFAKRTGFLKSDKWFYNYQSISIELSIKSSKIYNILHSKDPNIKFIVIYGELCGGFYRHPDVEKVQGAVKIQGRVDYHPDNMWVPFDILLRWEDGNRYLMMQTSVIELCEKFGLPHEQLLFLPWSCSPQPS